MKVLISTSSFGMADPKPLDLCRSKCEVVLNPYHRKLTAKEFFDLTSDVDGVIAGVETISREVLQKRPNLKVISRCGVGLDNVDQEACHAFGVKLYHTPEAPIDSVAELTITLILELLKNIIGMHQDLKQGLWRKQTNSLLSGKKVGIIGMGRIGKKAASLLSAFDAQIFYFDLEKQPVPYSFLPLTELLACADILTLHAAGFGDAPLLGKKELFQMKKGAILVNTARGSLLDETALYEALKQHHLQAAALDVFSEEPYSGKLLELDNLLLTPHIASSTKEGRAVMEREAVRHLLEGLGIAYD